MPLGSRLTVEAAICATRRSRRVAGRRGVSRHGHVTCPRGPNHQSCVSAGPTRSGDAGSQDGGHRSAIRGCGWFDLSYHSSIDDGARRTPDAHPERGA